MTPTTLVMPYYINAGMLKAQFEMLRNLPADLRDLIGVVVVDDGSPTAPAEPEDLSGIPLQIYRIDVDIRWNQDAARNIGVRHAENNWVLLTDIDHMVPSKTWRSVLTRDWDPENVYQFSRVSAPEMAPYKMHPNSWFMTRAMYDKIGGYDERLAGFYGTDGDFRDRVRTSAKKIIPLKDVLIRVPRTHIPDASTTTYLRKQPEDKGIRAVKEARDRIEGWVPERYRFPYHRVSP
jgi:hypothetical protein